MIVALASDPEVVRWNGQTKYASDLAAHYGVQDLDGNTPGSGIWSVEYVRDQQLRKSDYETPSPEKPT